MAHEFDGAGYAAASAPQKAWGRDLVAGLTLHGDENVLDLGCGDGVLSALIAARLPRGRVMGLDASRGMLDQARLLAGPNLEFRREDITRIEFQGEFDLVFSNSTLHWVGAHGPLLGRIHRALVPGGLLTANFAAQGNIAHATGALEKTMARPEFRPLFSGFTWPWYMPRPEEYQAVLAASPFAQAWLETENRDALLGQESYVGLLDQPCLVPFLAALPLEKKAQFRSLVLEEALGRARAKNGYMETFRRLVVTARKKA